MTGLTKGIDDRLSTLRSTLGGVSNEIASTGSDMTVPGAAGARGQGGAPVRVTFDVTGADEDMKRMIRKMVRVNGRGDVQVTFG